jgi:hypothetical protein
MVFPPTAPWWSAGSQRRRAGACLSLDGVGWHGRPEPHICLCAFLLGDHRLSPYRGTRHLPRWAVYCGHWGFNAATGRYEAFLLDTQAPFSPNGDVNRDGCVDDIDMMGVLFEFGELVNDFNRCVDVNRDGIIDDADLLVVLFNFGSGC